VWDAANVARVTAGLGKPLDDAERARRMEWRDRRLLALSSHKSAQSKD